jgi:hypothetical protein
METVHDPVERSARENSAFALLSLALESASSFGETMLLSARFLVFRYSISAKLTSAFAFCISAS